MHGAVPADRPPGRRDRRPAQAAVRAPSLIAAVVRDGDGRARHRRRRDPGAATATCSSGIGSITKSLTAAARARPARRGTAGPRRPGRRPPARLHRPAGVRLRELLGHAGGPAARAGRAVVGAPRRRSPGRPGRGRHRRRSSRSAAYHASTTPTSAYGLLGGVIERVDRPDAGGTRCDPAARPRSACAAPRYQPQEPFARGYVVHPWHHTLREEPRHDAGAMAPPASCGPPWTIWPAAAGRARRHRARPSARAAGADRRRRWRRRWSSPTSTAGPTGTAWACSCGGAVSGSSSDTPAPCPATWRSWWCTGRSGTGVVAFANTYSLPGTGIGRLGLSMLEAVLDTRAGPGAAAVAARGHRRRPTSRRCAAGGGGWAGSSRLGGTAPLVLRGRTAPRSAAVVAVHRRRAPTGGAAQTGEQAGEILAVRRDPRRRGHRASTSPRSSSRASRWPTDGSRLRPDRGIVRSIDIGPGLRDTARARPYPLLHVLRTDHDRRGAPLGAVRDLGAGVAGRHRVL